MSHKQLPCLLHHGELFIGVFCPVQTTDGSFKNYTFLSDIHQYTGVTEVNSHISLRSNMRFPSLPVFSCVALLLYNNIIIPKTPLFRFFFKLCLRRYGHFSRGLYVVFPWLPFLPLMSSSLALFRPIPFLLPLQVKGIYPKPVCNVLM